MGAGPVEELQLFRGRDIVAQAEPPSFQGVEDSSRIRVSWGGSRMRGRGRRVTWDGTIRVVGTRIVRVEPFAFDSPSDGILDLSDESLTFRSRTTGDRDGIDLWIEEPGRGMLRLETPIGELVVDLGSLGDEVVSQAFEGLNVRAEVKRYPEEPSERELGLELTVPAPTATVVPYFVKVIQVDGHMAWSSPVYLSPSEAGDRAE